MHKTVPALILLSIVTLNCYADKLDDFIKQEMQRRKIPGLSLAVIDGGKIVKATGYGSTQIENGEKVTTSTVKRTYLSFRPKSDRCGTGESHFCL